MFYWLATQTTLKMRVVHNVGDSAKNDAIGRAVEAGADPRSVEIVELDEVPLTYLPSNAILIRAKAAGDLASG